MSSSQPITAKIVSSEEREGVFELGRQIPPVPDNLPEPHLTSTGEYVAHNNYLRRDKNGQVVETAKEMFWRVAHNIAAADLLYGLPKEEMAKTREAFYQLLASLEFVPNTPTIANAAGNLQQLSACFVLPVEDDLDSIGKTFWQTMMIHKTGGGTGFSFSRLRPFGSIVRSTGRQSSGAIYFMWMYADATDRIQQGGYRRGANMGVMNIDHPDILRWITIKSAESVINSFNLSVALTDKFMEKVEEDSHFAPEGLKENEAELNQAIIQIQEVLRTPDLGFGDKVMAFEKEIEKLKRLVQAKEPGEGYELINPDTKMVEARLNARKMFELIARVAWEKGDPGVLFLDRINKDNPTPHLGQIEATNPCGEQPLLPYESCNLGAINLSRMVKGSDGKVEVDWEKIRQRVHLAVHFLDNVIDMNRYPLPEIDQVTRGNRKIGLGVMGWAGMLVQLGLPYNSSDAYRLAGELMQFIHQEARQASSGLAQKRGVFPNFKGSIYDPQSPYFKGEALFLRHAALTTIAPTGTTSMLADVNSGIEPFFALYYKKNIANGDQVEMLNPYLVQIAKEKGFWSEELLEKIKENKGSVRGLSEVPEGIQRLFPIAADISPEEHILVQAAFQKGGVDNAISKTINMASSATVDDFIRAYNFAYEQGCKGMTIYRDQSRKKQILVRGARAAVQEKKVVGGEATLDRPAPTSEISNHILIERPDRVAGATYRMVTPVGSAFITINNDITGDPIEVFVNIGKAGSDLTAMATAFGRMISTILRLNPNVSPRRRAEKIVDQLSGIGGRRSVGFGSNRIYSLPDAVAQALKRHLSEFETPSLFNAQGVIEGRDLQDRGQEQSSAVDTSALPNGEGGALPNLQAGAVMAAHNPDPTLAPAEQEIHKEVSENDINFERAADICPECGVAAFVFEEGCSKCYACGHSEC